MIKQTPWSDNVFHRMEMEKKPENAMKREELAGYLNDLRDCETFCEVGCGMLKKMKDLVDGDYLGTDITPEFEPDEICDVRDLPFKDNQFDVVFCKNVLQHIEEWKQGIREMCRVAKKYIVTMTRCSDKSRKSPLDDDREIPMQVFSYNEIREEKEKHGVVETLQISDVDDRVAIFVTRVDPSVRS